MVRPLDRERRERKVREGRAILAYVERHEHHIETTEDVGELLAMHEGVRALPHPLGEAPLKSVPAERRRQAFLRRVERKIGVIITDDPEKAGRVSETIRAYRGSGALYLVNVDAALLEKVLAKLDADEITPWRARLRRAIEAETAKAEPETQGFAHAMLARSVDEIAASLRLIREHVTTTDIDRMSEQTLADHYATLTKAQQHVAALKTKMRRSTERRHRK